MASYITCYNPGMETKDYIAQITRKGLEKLEVENSETQEFRNWWGRARQMIDKVAREGWQGVREVKNSFRLEPTMENGGIQIGFSWNPQQVPAASLRFSPDHENRKILCTSSPKDLGVEEIFDRDRITEDVIGHKLGEFLTAVFERRAREIRKGG